MVIGKTNAGSDRKRRTSFVARLAGAAAVAMTALVVPLMSVIPATAAPAGPAPAMIGHGNGGDGGGSAQTRSSTWISLIPATSSAIAPPPATSPSSVWISLIPATSSAIAQTTRSQPTTAAAAAATGMSRGTPDALRRDAVADPRHADAVGAPLDPVGDSGGSAGRWAVLAAALVLVIAAGVAVVVRARRLHQR